MYEYEKVLNFYGIYLKSLKQNVVCPFHGDVNASLSIDVVNNRSFCFGCGFKGNAFDFVKEMEDCEVIAENDYISAHCKRL